VEYYLEELWLFGSYARRDESHDSDVDILVVGECAPDEHGLALYLRDLNIIGYLSCSHYTQTGLSALISHGALFAWHLRLEGCPLVSKQGWLASALDRIAPYRTFVDDLKVLQIMVDEVIESLIRDEYTLTLEASILGVALRNTAMMISFVTGRPAFSSSALFGLRSHDVVRKLFDRLGLALIADLIAARLVTERGRVASRQWTRSELMLAAQEIGQWLNDVRRITTRGEAYYAAPIPTSPPTGTPIGADRQLSAAARNAASQRN
jgi:hypothetical protein